MSWILFRAREISSGKLSRFRGMWYGNFSEVRHKIFFQRRKQSRCSEFFRRSQNSNTSFLDFPKKEKVPKLSEDEKKSYISILNFPKSEKKSKFFSEFFQRGEKSSIAARNFLKEEKRYNWVMKFSKEEKKKYISILNFPKAEKILK